MKWGDAVTAEVTSSNDVVIGSKITPGWSNEQWPLAVVTGSKSRVVMRSNYVVIGSNKCSDK